MIAKRHESKSLLWLRQRIELEEDGAILPIIGLMIVVLLVFAALTVDLGAAWGERRHDQTAADAGALAAAVEASGLSGVTIQGLVDEAVAFVELNLDRTIDQADWLACTDSSPLTYPLDHPDFATLSLSPATECISFGGFDASGTLEEIRVKLPDQLVDTSFAALIGIDTIAVSAVAQARILIPTESASPPFAVPNGNAAGDEVCLRTGPNGTELPYLAQGNGPGDLPENEATWPDPPGTGNPDPCDDLQPASQFFFNLAPSSYEECKATSEFSLTVADGIDHTLSSFEPDYPGPGHSPVIEEGCKGSDPLRFFPNTMPLAPGMTANQLKCGLLSTTGGCSSGPLDASGTAVTPRLQRGPYAKSNEFAGKPMENKALWDPDFFQPGTNGPPSCGKLETIASGGPAGGYPAADWDYFDRKELMMDCLQGWHMAASKGPLFTTALVEDSARFAYLPYLAEDEFGGSPVHFNSFVPAFLHKLYQTENENKPEDWDPFCFYPDPGPDNQGWFLHEAGQDFDCGLGNSSVDRLGAIVLHCGMLPGDSCLPDGPPSNPTGQPRLIIELTH